MDGYAGTWDADTLVTAYDRAAVEAIAARAAADTIHVAIRTTRRGVPFVVLPARWLIGVSVDELEYGMAVPNLGYLRDVVAHHDARQIATPLLPGEGLVTGPATPTTERVPDTAELGEDWKKWEL